MHWTQILTILFVGFLSVHLASAQLLDSYLKVTNRTDTQYLGAIVWGSNHIGSHDLNPEHYEPSLRHLCETRDDLQLIFIHGILSHKTPYVYRLSPAVRKHAQTGSLLHLYAAKKQDIHVPGLNLGNHCIVRNPALRLEKGAPPAPLSLLQCPHIGDDILYCQREKGKLIFLNIVNSMGDATFQSAEDAEMAAYLYWNLFFGGQELPELRPFGPHVTLDGLNIIPRDKPEHYDTFALTLKSLMNKANAEPAQQDLPPKPVKKSKSSTNKQDYSRQGPYYLAATPKCAYPDTFLGPILEARTNLFDLLVVEFTSSTGCTFAKQALFWQTLDTWNNWATMSTKQSKDESTEENKNSKAGLPSLLLGLPASKVGGLSAPGDYIPLDDLIRFQFLSHLQGLHSVRGIYFLDYSCDALNLPCLPQRPSLENEEDDSDSDVGFIPYSGIFLKVLNQLSKNNGRAMNSITDLESLLKCKMRKPKDLDNYWKLPKGFFHLPDPISVSSAEQSDAIETTKKKRLEPNDEKMNVPPRKNDKEEDLKDYGCGPGIRKCFRPKGHKVKDNQKPEQGNTLTFSLIAPLFLVMLFLLA